MSNVVGITPELLKVYDGLRKSAALDLVATGVEGEELLQVLQAKAANDLNVLQMAKTAGAGALLSQVGTAAGKFLKTPVGKGLGYAAGAAVPAVVAGNMIADNASEKFRDRALQAGAGLAGIGATMYGLHRATNSLGKQAADENEAVLEALNKLATIGYLDVFLSETEVDELQTPEARKLATEVRSLNAEYGVSILRNLVE